MHAFLIVLSVFTCAIIFVVVMIFCIFRLVEGRFPHTPWFWFDFDKEVMFLHDNLPEFQNTFKLHDLEKNENTLAKIFDFLNRYMIIKRNREEITYWEFIKIMSKIRLDMVFIKRIGLLTLHTSSNYLYMNNGSQSVLNGINRQRYIYFIGKLNNNIEYTNLAITEHNKYVSRDKKLPMMIDNSVKVVVKSPVEIVKDVIENNNSEFENLVNKYKSKGN